MSHKYAFTSYKNNVYTFAIYQRQSKLLVHVTYYNSIVVFNNESNHILKSKRKKSCNHNEKVKLILKDVTTLVLYLQTSLQSGTTAKIIHRKE